MSSWFAGSSDKPLIIAHRGASSERPENTMGAFRLALEQGANGLELDVHLSADGVPVVIHDARLNRTTNGHGKVFDKTFEALKKLDAGGGETLPSLEELFDEFGPSTLYNIELKNYSIRPTGIEQAVAELVGRYQLEEQVLVSSFQPAHLRRYKRQAKNAPKAYTALLRYKRFRFTRYFYQGEADHPWYSLIDEEYMRWATRQNLRVHAWTADDLEEARRLARLGVHAIITNRPSFLCTNL